MRSLVFWPLVALLLLARLPSLRAQAADKGALDSQFQSAVAQYDAGHFAEAAKQLEALQREAPESFEVQELLGLVYSAQSQDAVANEHLAKAVRLQPNSAAARTNLAANLMRLRKPEQAEEQFRKAVELEPGNADANHNLGEAYIRAGNVAKSLPFLEQAQKIDASSYDNGYDLSLAYLVTARLGDARQLVQELISRKNTPELHNLLGQIEEKDGKFVAAENEFELAARAEPSESNLFDWGSELLLHRTLEPAITVFQQASTRYPDSPRLAIGLGMALYGLGKYDDAVKSLLRAADLSPSEPNCYLFLAKAYDSSPSQADEVIQRFQRYAQLQPRNASAQYYYAMSLWKGKRAQDPDLDLHRIEALLKTSIALNPKFAEAHLQLGNLYSDQNHFAAAIPEYQRAGELNPDLSDVYYRLGQAYVRTGEKDRAQEQFETYQKIRAQHLAELDKQKAEIRQFVYSAKDSPTARP